MSSQAARADSAEAPRPAAPAARPGSSPAGLVLLALVPLALLVALLATFSTFGGALVGSGPIPPDALGKLDLERISFRPGELLVQVVNSGPTELTVAQVIVNEALWDFEVAPETPIPRLGRATIRVPYPWLEGEPHEVKLVTSNGLAFTRAVAFAAPTPEPQPSVFLAFALLGLYVGVVPVFLGLFCFPLLRRLGRGPLDFILALTVGLLLFLGFDAVHEALALAERVPGPFRGFSLVGIGLVGALLALASLRRSAAGRSDGAEADRRLGLAYQIALSIGLHNLGEGLAIGAAYAVGELALGALLVVGFTLHNTTEGVGIVALLARQGAALKHLLALGLLAGGPTILGVWLGGFTYSDLWATLFLAIGSGAIFQVVYELARLPGRGGPAWLLAPTGAAGLLAGLLIMYFTGLLVVL